jgi:hypothetical protein
VAIGGLTVFIAAGDAAGAGAGRGAVVTDGDAAASGDPVGSIAAGGGGISRPRGVTSALVKLVAVAIADGGETADARPISA